jgi:predicted secreted protein
MTKSAATTAAMTTTATTTAAAAASRFAALALILAVAIGAAAPPAQWTEADHGKTVALKIGEAATLTLTASAGTGYLWVLDPVDDKVLAIGEKKIVPDPQGRLGGPAQTIFPVTAKGKGSVALKAQLVRPWVADQPAKVVTIKVEVK